ncbi:M13 family metallopeptidase N-terminal domain-containing protein [Meridianimarinicoccus marinus]
MKIAISEAGANAATAPKGSRIQRVGDFYNAFMDTAALDAAGLAPLQPELDRVARMSDMDDLIRFIGNMVHIGTPALLMGFGPEVDLADSTVYATYGGSGSFGAPKEFTDLLGNSAGAHLLEAYRAYVQAVMEIAGRSPEQAARSQTRCKTWNPRRRRAS